MQEGHCRTPTSTAHGNAELDLLPRGVVRSSLIASAYGRVYVIGSALAGLWLLLQRGSAANPALVASVAAIALVMGLLLLSSRGAGLSIAALQRLGMTANAAVSVAWLGAGPGSTEFAVLYLWTMPLGLVFSRRSTTFWSAMVAVAGAAAVLAWQTSAAGWSSRSLMGALATWLLVAGGVGVVGHSARWAAQHAPVADNRILRSLSASSTGVALMTPEGVITEANQALATFFEAPPGGLVGRHAGELTHPEDLDATEALFAELRQRYDAGEPAAAAIEKRCLTVQGNVRWSTVRALMLDGADGKPFVFTQVIDITDRVEAARSAERSSRIERLRHDRQRVVADFTKRTLTSGSLDDVAEDAVKLLADMLEVPLAYVLQLSGDGSDLMLAAGVGWSSGLVRRATVPSSERFIDGYTMRVDDLVAVVDLQADRRFSASPLLIAHGVESGMCGPIRGPEGPYGVLGVYAFGARTFDTDDQMLLQQVADIIGAVTARARSERALAHHAMHDHLTGLPNRYLFHDRLSQHLNSKATKDGDGNNVCVLLLDLDNFKLVNETLGHAAGDELLVAVAPRLRETAGDGATIARLGGDEFAVLIDNARGEVNPLAVARHLLSRISEPVTLGLSHTIHVTASIGVAFGSRRSQTAGEVLREADAALYRAKEAGRNRVELFDEVLHARAATRLTLESEVRRALADGEFTCAYQPIVSVDDGTVTGFEALARWQRRDGSVVPPSRFVPASEEAGLISVLGEHVLRTAAQQLAAWQQAQGEVPPLTMSVNVSAKQLQDPHFPDLVATVLTEHPVGSDTLGLELTESILLDDADHIRAALVALRSLGVKLLLDDFGTGYSSLAYLKRLPIHVLKIDRAFVDGLPHDEDDVAITRAIITMATSLRLDVIAEGVETEEQARCLRELGCRRAQGYFWARPLPAREATIELAGRAVPRLSR